MTDDNSTESRTMSLVLGSGGARGLAHIGAIKALEERGFRIESIAGSSMGALVGGMHAAGRLDDYAEWVSKLAQSDVFKLVDWTFSGGGLIRGDRIRSEPIRTEPNQAQPPEGDRGEPIARARKIGWP